MSTTPKRVITIDIMRALAIVLMVIFHFLYDLKYFGYVDWDTPDGEGWREYRYVILTLFFLCVGFGIGVVHQQKILLTAFLKRLGLVLGAAGLVTVSSLIMVPENWIFFGVLHFIAVASVLALPFARYPLVALLFGILAIVVFNLNWVSSTWPFSPIRHLLPSYTNDYVGIFPWIGMVLIGVWLAQVKWMQSDPLGWVGHNKSISFMSKHSLLIYLVHQPIFFALFGLYGLVFAT